MLRSTPGRILIVIGLVSCAGLAIGDKPAAEKSGPRLKTQRREPAALVVQGNYLLAANRQSGTITVIDRSRGTILAEHAIADRISDVASVPGASCLLVVDDQRRQLFCVRWEEDRPAVRNIAELPIAGSQLVFDEDRRIAYITAKWSHRLLAVTLNDDLEQAGPIQSLELPLAPRELLLLPEQKTLIVADAFGGRLAVVDAEKLALAGVRETQGHNIRGLALSADGKSVLIAHQQIPDGALADYEEVHWGRMISNAVEVVGISKLINGDDSKTVEGWLDRFGDVGSAMADPSGVLAGPGGLTAVAFSGVGEVAVDYKGYKKRIPVGTFPAAMTAAGGRLYVANRLDDSISVIDLNRGELMQTISLGPRPRSTSEERGERLFFNAKLSHDGWLSCHSCHTEGHTSGLVVDTLGDGDYGAPKLVPSLLGTRDTQPWSWDGSAGLLREQVQKSLTTTMHGEPLSARDMEDLFAYLTSLDPPPPAGSAPKELIHEGQGVFKAQGCVNCHAPPAFTTPVTVDVSLLDEHKRSRFNPPSLRGVSQRQRYFHDGRANRLEDVLLKVRHQLDEPLGKHDAQALLAFLRSL